MPADCHLIHLKGISEKLQYLTILTLFAIL